MWTISHWFHIILFGSYCSYPVFWQIVLFFVLTRIDNKEIIWTRIKLVPGQPLANKRERLFFYVWQVIQTHFICKTRIEQKELIWTQIKIGARTTSCLYKREIVLIYATSHPGTIFPIDKRIFLSTNHSTGNSLVLSDLIYAYRRENVRIEKK